MKRLKSITFSLFFLMFSPLAFTHLPPYSKNDTCKGNSAHFRSDCAAAKATTDLAINNVRAKLSTGGDTWWNGGYVVPVVPAGSPIPEVSSIYAGSIWVGGVDEGGNLKVAAQTYGHDSGLAEFWPGPLSNQGETDAETCSNWDRFFTVSKNSIDLFRANWGIAQAEGRTELESYEIPDEIKGWPSLGNPFFADIHGFALPTSDQADLQLADFWDEGGTPGVYEPQFGDFPVLNLPDCDFISPPPRANQMIFSITNDGGGIHGNSSGDPIFMEIHTTAFAFKTDDEINDMTFYKYKMVNRSIETLKDTYMGIWMDPDLGCYSDDYVGCDSTRNLSFVYNSDDLDGESGCDDCGPVVATYCDQIPVLGLDFLSTPKDEFGEELGMSSFTYQITNTGSTPFPSFNASVVYNTLSGKWPDGTRMTQGGNGFDPNSTDFTNYAFPSPPNDENGWSMCQENLPFEDRRMTQATGPFDLLPGAVNTLVAGLIWVPDVAHPCPDLDRFFEADEKAQQLFDQCFDTATGINPIQEEQASIKIVPNPFILSSPDHQTIQLHHLPKASKLSLFNISGRLLKKYDKLENDQLDIKKDLGARLSNGTYILQILTEGKHTQAFKLLILE